MITVKVALRPDSEAPRQTRGGVGRGTTNYYNYGITVDTKAALRRQYLLSLGVIGSRADVLAFLAWGGAHGEV